MYIWALMKVRKNLRIDEDLMKHVDKQPLVKKKGFTWYVEKALKKVSKYKEPELV